MPRKRFRGLINYSVMLLLLFSATKAYANDGPVLPDGLSQETFERIERAVVRVGWQDGQNFGTGVCVTPEGHVVIRNTTTPRFRPMLAGDRVQFHFPDGRTAEGTALGWSEEWGIAVAKVAGNGPWPHIGLDRRSDLTVGSPCLSLEYVPDKGPYPTKPSVAIGKITCVSAGRWLSSNCDMDGMAPLFGFQGTLIGTTTVMPFGHDNVQTHIAIIDHLWSDLIAGHNVDKVRAYSTTDNEPPLPTSNGKHESTNGKLNAARIAKLTTVRLRPVEKSGGFGDEGWSGVVISPDGFVATCAHHMCVPGEQVTVHFSDGTAARGRILGSSRVTDIGLVKITDKSNLRFAKLGFSRTCAPGDRCFVSGYPTTSEQLAPMIIETAVVEPDGYVWSSILLTSADYETSPGFSGGGVFDTNGSLIAVHEGKNRGDVGRHRRSEFFRLQWKDLKSGRILGRPNGDDGAAH